MGVEVKSKKEGRKYTIEDYRALPEGAPYQLIGGELVSSPAPSTYHQKVLRNLFVVMWSYVSGKGLGELLFSPIDVYLEEGEAYQPDIVFVSKERMGIIKGDGIWGAPDMVIEILSKSTAYYDMKHKKRVYERSGVREYWIVDPYEKSVEVYERRGERFELVEYKKEGKVRSEVLGLEIDLKNIF